MEMNFRLRRRKLRGIDDPDIYLKLNFMCRLSFSIDIQALRTIPILDVKIIVTGSTSSWRIGGYLTARGTHASGRHLLLPSSLEIQNDLQMLQLIQILVTRPHWAGRLLMLHTLTIDSSLGDLRRAQGGETQLHCIY